VGLLGRCLTMSRRRQNQRGEDDRQRQRGMSGAHRKSPLGKLAIGTPLTLPSPRGEDSVRGSCRLTVSGAGHLTNVRALHDSPEGWLSNLGLVAIDTLCVGLLVPLSAADGGPVDQYRSCGDEWPKTGGSLPVSKAASGKGVTFQV